MRIADMLARGRPTVSFEFMAPRDDSEVDVLEQTVATLAGHAPDWVSVTYRVRTGDKTLELVTRIKRHYHIEAMAHLTCANTADRTRQILNWMEREGVANVLALRGDPPVSGEPFAAIIWRTIATADAYASLPNATSSLTRTISPRWTKARTISSVAPVCCVASGRDGGAKR